MKIPTSEYIGSEGIEEGKWKCIFLNGVFQIAGQFS